MRSRALTTALPVFATLHVIVITAPAAVLAVVARKGGLTGAHGLDLVAISLVLGGVHASIVWRRLNDEREAGVRFADAFIAELDALVVLAAMVTGLVFLVLGGFAPEHAAIVNRGWEVIWLWTGVLLAAIAAAEITRSAVLRWLQGDAAAEPRRDWSDDGVTLVEDPGHESPPPRGPGS